MMIEDVIRELRIEYYRCVNTPYVKKPISNALYNTWLLIDKQEKERETERSDEYDRTADGDEG